MWTPAHQVTTIGEASSPTLLRGSPFTASPLQGTSNTRDRSHEHQGIGRLANASSVGRLPTDTRLEPTLAVDVP